VRRKFKSCIPDWIRLKLKAQAHWNAVLQTLESDTNWFSSVAFSLNGKQVMSGSNNKTVRLWNAAAGAPLQTLEGHTHWLVWWLFHLMVSNCQSYKYPIIG
ncbi:hypothetical protein B0O99DRAFT_521899, partial [Bisporella sp. PMI_857]